VVVRAEEALIVAFVLLLWVAAIALFFNRWGKIRCVYKLYVDTLDIFSMHQPLALPSTCTVALLRHNSYAMRKGDRFY
jgi:hypothetical protein